MSRTALIFSFLIFSSLEFSELLPPSPRNDILVLPKSSTILTFSTGEIENLSSNLSPYMSWMSFIAISMNPPPDSSKALTLPIAITSSTEKGSGSMRRSSYCGGILALRPPKLLPFLASDMYLFIPCTKTFTFFSTPVSSNDLFVISDIFLNPSILAIRS